MNENTNSTEEFGPVMNERMAARYLGLSPATLATWRCTGSSLPFLRYSSRCIRYERRSLDSWKAARVAHNTAERTEAEVKEASRVD